MSVSKLPEFTPEAKIFWDSLTTQRQAKLLSFFNCGVCKTTVGVNNFKGSIHKSYLFLEGSCAVCGDEIDRLYHLDTLR
jgi:hypothetical protein